MGIRCAHCGWHGALDDRVPATPEWVAANKVDAAHFLGNSLNCPTCGESSAWSLTGEDDLAFSADDGEYLEHGLAVAPPA